MTIEDTIIVLSVFVDKSFLIIASIYTTFGVIKVFYFFTSMM